MLYLSHYFKQHRQRYYDLLQNIRDNGDWETWLKFFLTAVSEVSLEATETARQIVALREHHRRRIVASLGRATANALTVLESLYSHPIITVNNIATMTGVSFTAANNLMSRFVEEKILIEVTGQSRNRQFRYSDYINLLKEGRFCLKRALIEQGGEDAARQAFEAFYSAKGEQRIQQRVAYFAPKVGVSPTGTAVKELGYRWASCTKGNSLAFHWKCLMAPPKIIDYMVVHELCHMHRRDHSDAFWNEVDKVMPDYGERKMWLKKHGAGLDI